MKVETHDFCTTILHRRELNSLLSSSLLAIKFEEFFARPRERGNIFASTKLQKVKKERKSEREKVQYNRQTHRRRATAAEFFLSDGAEMSHRRLFRLLKVTGAAKAKKMKKHMAKIFLVVYNKGVYLAAISSREGMSE